MSSAPPPIQNPNERCPNCGAYLPGSLAYCANCGYGRPAARPGANTAQLIWVLLFILVGLPAGCLGGCFLLIGLSAPTSANDWSFWLLTLFAVAVFISLLAMLIVSSRRKK